MSSLQAITANEDEQEFKFEIWVNNNGLSDIKHLLLKHNMNTIDTLCVTSSEFQNLMSDPQLLAKAQLIPNIIAALKKIPEKKTDKVFIFVSDAERNVMNNIKSYIKQLNEYKTSLTQLSIEYPNSLERIKKEKEKHIEAAVNKVNKIFNQIIDTTKERQKSIIYRLEQIKYSNEKQNDNNNLDDDEKKDYTDQSLLVESQKMLQTENENLTQSLSVINNKLKTMHNEKMRQTDIQNIGNKARKDFNEIKQKLTKNVSHIEKLLDNNTKTVVGIDYVVDNEQLNKILNDINSIGSVVNNIHKPSSLPKLKWSIDWNHKDGLTFLTELKDKIKICPKTMSAAGCCADFVIKDENWDVFKWKVVVPKMDYETYIGFIDYKDVKEWITNKNCAYPKYCIYPYSSEKTTLRVWLNSTSQPNIKVQNKVTNGCKIVLEFEVNMKKNNCNVWFHDQNLGIVFSNIPKAIVPAVCSYRSNDNDYEISFVSGEKST
eukprot:211587_1